MRLFLDTTYLMPLAGLETDKFGKEDAKMLYGLRDFVFVASPVSLIEIKWVIISKTRGDPVLRKRLRREYRLFLDFLLYGDVIELTPLLDERIDEEENKLLDLGIADYFDRIIFSTALYRADALLTEDEALRETWEKEGYDKIIKLYTWNSFKLSFLRK